MGDDEKSEEAIAEEVGVESANGDESRDEADSDAGSGESEAPEEDGDQNSVQAVGQATEELSAKRQSMLELIDKWMPTSLNDPRVPEGETQDLMARAGWTKARGQASKLEKD